MMLISLLCEHKLLPSDERNSLEIYTHIRNISQCTLTR